jgi:hypothetical protein
VIPITAPSAASHVNNRRPDLFPEARRISHTSAGRRGPLYAARRFRSAIVNGWDLDAGKEAREGFLLGFRAIRKIVPRRARREPTPPPLSSQLNR